MKAGSRPAAAKKTMRVATTLTGAAACAAAIAPAATAQAATPARHTAGPELKIVDLGPAGKTGHKVRVPGRTPRSAAPDAQVPDLHYHLGLTISGVSKFHVCGYHGNGSFWCTGSTTNLNKADRYRFAYSGASWRRGLTEVYWNGGGPGRWDECNTNGGYNGFTGYFVTSSHGYHIVSTPSWVWLSPVGPGRPEC